MTISWMVYVLIVGSLLAFAALAIDGVLRRSSLPTRWVWIGSLAAIAGFALLAPRTAAAPVRTLVALEQTAAGSDAVQTPAFGLLDRVGLARAAAVRSMTKGIAAMSDRIPSSLAMPMIVGWAALSAVLLACIVAVNLRANRLLSAWPSTELHGTPVRIAPSVGPAVIGVRRPAIVLPRWMLARSADDQRLVITHEREHLAGHDQWLMMAAWTIAALLPWHPAAWWVLSRLRLAIELDCDARVLRRGIAPQPYGTLLIDIAGYCAGHRTGALALADRSSHLERRLLAMKNTRPRFTVVRAIGLGAVASLAIVMACETKLPTSAEISDMDVASLERNATAAKFLATYDFHGRPVYVVDGTEVTEEVADKIAANKIESIEILKSKVRAEVRIATKVKGVPAAPGDTVFEMRQRLPLMKVQRSDTVTWVSRTGTPVEAMFVTTSDQAGNAVTKPALEITGKALSRRSFDGILLVDGVRVDQSALDKLNGENIESVEVLKGAAALRLYTDPAAANGVILIKTKRQ